MNPGSKQIAGTAISAPPACTRYGMMYDKECSIMCILAWHGKHAGDVKHPSFEFGKIYTKFSTRRDRQRQWGVLCTDVRSYDYTA